MQQDRDRKLLGGKVEGAMHHLRQSQKRWAAGDCPSLPLERRAWAAGGGHSAVMRQLEKAKMEDAGLFL